MQILTDMSAEIYYIVNFIYCGRALCDGQFNNLQLNDNSLMLYAYLSINFIYLLSYLQAAQSALHQIVYVKKYLKP